MNRLRLSLLTTGIACLLATAVQAQMNAIDTYFKQYVEDDRFTVVYISPKLFQLIDKLDMGDMEMNDESAGLVKDLAKDLRGLRILTTDEDGDRYYKEARNLIDTKLYESLLTVRQPDGGDVDFMIRENGEGVIEELLLVAGGDGKFTLLSFIGKIDLDKVARLAQEMDKEGEDKENDGQQN